MAQGVGAASLLGVQRVSPCTQNGVGGKVALALQAAGSSNALVDRRPVLHS